MNPIIRQPFTADPTVLQHDGKVYLYTGHDEPPDGVDDYVMKNWLCFSSDNLRDWTAHPSPLRATDFAWASGDAFASKVVRLHDEFYWFAAVSHRSIPGKAIGMAKSPSPTGPFEDALGRPLISGDMLPRLHNDKENLDPTVLQLADGKMYIAWGYRVCHIAQLNASLTGIEGPIQTIGLPDFSEGSHLFERNGILYLMYGAGKPEKVAYATADRITGPWAYRGIVCAPARNSETNRTATLEFEGKWWFFYHNGALPGGGSHRRSVCMDELVFDADGSIREVVMS